MDFARTPVVREAHGKKKQQNPPTIVSITHRTSGRLLSLCVRRQHRKHGGFTLVLMISIFPFIFGRASSLKSAGINAVVVSAAQG